MSFTVLNPPATAARPRRSLAWSCWVESASGSNRSVTRLPKCPSNELFTHQRRKTHAERDPQQRRRDADPRLRRLPDPRRGDRQTVVEPPWPPDTGTSTPPPPTATRKPSAARSRRAASPVRNCSSPPSLDPAPPPAAWRTTPSARSRTRCSRLGLDYLDLYLIHRPLGDYYSEWRAMQEINNRAGPARSGSPTSTPTGWWT